MLNQPGIVEASFNLMTLNKNRQQIKALEPLSKFVVDA
jgi:hypothetical protein